MEKAKQWYVIYTRVGGEMKVCDSLRRRKIDSFCPTNKLSKTSYGRERVMLTPIIEKHVFAYISPDEQEEIENLDYVIGFMHWLSKPVVIDEKDITLMRDFCERYSDIQLKKTKVLSVNPASISTQYPDYNTERVNLHFPALGYNLIAEENRPRVKVITISDYHKPESSNNQYAETR